MPVITRCCVILLCAVALSPSVGAAAWSPPQNLSADTDATAWSDIAVASDGTLHAVWTNQSTREMTYSTRPPGGSWAAPVVVGTYAATTIFADGDIAVAVAPDGTVHIVYADDSSGHSEIYHRSLPVGGSWSARFDISQTPGTRSEFPDVAVTPNGTVHAIWIDATPSGGICCSETYYSSMGVGGGWSPPINVSNSGANEYEIRLGTGPDNSVHILTAQEDGGPGRQNIYLYTKPPGGSFGAGDNLINNPNIGRNMGGVVQTADGTVHVVYYENNPSEVIYQSKPACGSWSGPVNLSSNASSSGNPDIAADACGTVHVAWVDDLSGGQVLYRGLPLGGSWTVTLGISGGAPSAGRVRIATTGARDNTVGTVEVVYQCSPGGISDAFFTEASLLYCGQPAVVAVFDPAENGVGAAPDIRAVPNPSRGQVRLEAPAAGEMGQVGIFDMAGRLWRTIDLTPGAQGWYEADWDGRAADGSIAPAGMYWARMKGTRQGRATPVVLVR